MKLLPNVMLTIAAAIFVVVPVSCNDDNGGAMPDPEYTVSVPTEGNTWLIRNPDADVPQVSNPGDQPWTDTELILRTFFRVEQAGDLDLGIRVRVESGTSLLEADFAGQTRELEVSDQAYTNYYVGTYDIETPGYYYLDIKGISRESLDFADIGHVLLGGSATLSGIHYIDEDYFYWGRRGPSVHLTYDIPDEASDVRWFYNEVTVPDNNDVIGSFYMTNGFGQGYFGFQVNSEQERRILFSVWSPFQTDDPSEIPEDKRVELLAQGEGVTVQDFGNEGSGGQSFLRYNWQAGNTYRFLLRGEPAGDNKTDYTAYFYAPETGKWRLIASWRRPETDTWLTGIHSFLENFNTRTGPLPRKAYYNNQWIKDTSGNWYELTRARFTADATARAEARLDYAGGFAGEQEGFFMKNCGFFDETTQIDTYFTRPALNKQPDVDLSELP